METRRSTLLAAATDSNYCDAIRMTGSKPTPAALVLINGRSCVNIGESRLQAKMRLRESDEENKVLQGAF